ncbi:hypothetical protein P4310_02225 [Bacillus thuringiensis]|uniref:hypothetical protein n=1 Tax=Bacillus thuringiensis TaxID=1428 RepID=UPI0020CE908F|nr:hypothetical protein [Bacillus thuringiensis]MED3064374.1 hypothetical protein [Bacillus thuringiensis]
MKKFLVSTGIVKPAIRLSNIKNSLQFFSEGGEGDDPAGDGGGTPETFTKEQVEAQIQAEVNRVAGKIRKRNNEKPAKVPKRNSVKRIKQKWKH